MKLVDILAESFFDGFGPGGLFVRARRPGAPTKVFASSQSDLLLGELETLLGKADPDDLPEVTARLEPLREWMKQKSAASRRVSASVSPSALKG